MSHIRFAVVALVGALVRPVLRRMRRAGASAMTTVHGVAIAGAGEPWIDHGRQAIDLIANTSPWHLGLVQRYCPLVTSKLGTLPYREIVRTLPGRLSSLDLACQAPARGHSTLMWNMRVDAAEL